MIHTVTGRAQQNGPAYVNVWARYANGAASRKACPTHTPNDDQPSCSRQALPNASADRLSLRVSIVFAARSCSSTPPVFSLSVRWCGDMPLGEIERRRGLLTTTVARRAVAPGTRPRHVRPNSLPGTPISGLGVQTKEQAEGQGHT